MRRKEGRGVCLVDRGELRRNPNETKNKGTFARVEEQGKGRTGREKEGWGRAGGNAGDERAPDRRFGDRDERMQRQTQSKDVQKQRKPRTKGLVL